jgi:hypothetical protein
MTKRVYAYILIAMCCGLVAALLSTQIKRDTFIVATSPPDGTDAVRSSRSLLIGFRHDMEAASLNQNTIRLTAGETPEPIRISYRGTSRTVEVEPAAPLRPDTDYHLSVGLQPGLDAAEAPRTKDGRQMADLITSRFRTAPPAAAAAREGAILVIAGPGDAFAGTYPDILQAEGFGWPEVIPADRITAKQLAKHLTKTDIVLLASRTVPPPIAAQLEAWVKAGGGLIAMRPGPELAALTGLTTVERTVESAYLLPDRDQEPSRGLTHRTLQIHGPADVHATEGLTVLAHLYADASRPLGAPAVAMRPFGNGRVASFAYDLAGSVVKTRQGNPAWVNQERDGLSPRRTNDLFFPNHLDLTRVDIPQADEQQRLLANLIVTMAKRPLPRLWYLPGHRRVAIIMAGDDHAMSRATVETFAQLLAASTPNCRLDQWECLRATSYVTPPTRLSTADAKHYAALGFEIAPHVDTGCRDRSDIEVAATVRQQFASFRERYPDLEPRTHRIHCVVWNGWTTLADIEHDEGVRLDMNYYYWPPFWVRDHVGYMTGSGLPMRYIGRDGHPIDVFQATTHLANDSKLPGRSSIQQLIEAALDDRQYFALIGVHYDYTDALMATLLNVAIERKVALVTAAQVLAWLEARAHSSLETPRWDGRHLTFMARIAGRDDIYVDVPASWNGRSVSRVECAGQSLPHLVQTLKGLAYASFPVRSGRCTVAYDGEFTVQGPATVPRTRSGALATAPGQ